MQATLLAILQQQQVVGHDMINNIEKINIIENAIDNLNYHISILSNDLESNPTLDVIGKTPRSEILIDFLSQKMALEEEKNSLMAN